MKTTKDIETAIAVRCAALSLARSQAQVLAERKPFPSDLVHILGLNPDTLEALPAKRWLRMAAQTSSVSYRGSLTEDVLLTVLVSGNMPDEYRAHITCFLEEAPMQLVVMSIEQAAKHSGVSITRIWYNIAQLNRTLEGCRLEALSESICIAHKSDQ